MASKKIPSSTKTDSQKDMTCKYCESACSQECSTTQSSMHMGQSTRQYTSYFCNDDCVLAYYRQEMTIDLQKTHTQNGIDIAKIKQAYAYCLKNPKNGVIIVDKYAQSKLHFLSHYNRFIDGLISRKSTEELHLLRLKAKKYCGEMIEWTMENDHTSELDYACNIANAPLADDAMSISIFAND